MQPPPWGADSLLLAGVAIAGDLANRIYNAWLVQLAETGQAQRLAIAPQPTNVLPD